MQNAWEESQPAGTELAKHIDDKMRQIKVDVRERGGVEHITYANESGMTDVWEHKSGQCKVVYVGTKATFPVFGKKGSLAIATDLNDLLYEDTGTEWKQIKTTYIGTKSTFPAFGNKGALAIATDEGNTMYFDNVTAWVLIYGVNKNTVTASNAVYTLSPNYVDMPNMSITLVTKMKPILVKFSVTYTYGNGYIRLLCGGNEVLDVTSYVTATGIVYKFTIIDATVGSNIIKLQYHKDTLDQLAITNRSLFCMEV